jgi:hypothetical protein
MGEDRTVLRDDHGHRAAIHIACADHGCLLKADEAGFAYSYHPRGAGLLVGVQKAKGGGHRGTGGILMNWVDWRLAKFKLMTAAMWRTGFQ